MKCSPVTYYNRWGVGCVGKLVRKRRATDICMKDEGANPNVWVEGMSFKCR